MKSDEIERIDFSGWPIPDKYVVEVGRLALLWSTLERTLERVIGKMIDIDDGDPRGFIVIQHTSVPQKIDMFGALCGVLLKTNSYLEGYKEVVSKIKTAQKLRNKYMHNGMHYNKESEMAHMVQGSARGALKFKHEDIKVADIRRAIMAVDEASIALLNLVFKTDYAPYWKRRKEGKIKPI